MPFSLSSRSSSAFPVIVACQHPRRHFDGCSVFTHVTARITRLLPEEVVSGRDSALLLPSGPLLVLPVGARVSRGGLSPTERSCISRHTQQYLRACYPSGRYGTKGLVVRWFTDGREPRGTDNEPSGNRSLEPHAWLTDVLTRLPEWPEERLAELLPLEGFTFFG